MSLPQLSNWPQTASGLHRGAVLLGAIQRLVQPLQPAYLELGLQLLPQGLSTGVLPAGGRVVLDFSSASLVYSPASGARIAFPMNGRPQSLVFTDLFDALAQRELAGVLPQGDSLFARVTAGIAARAGRYRLPERETLLAEALIEIDQATAADYLSALQTIFTGVARFRARRIGMMTPLVVWPEHFDLSTLLFTGHEIDERQLHLNFGFAPYSEGLDYPYLYAYAYPYPDQYAPPALPEGARWHTQGWTGMVLPYEVIAAQPDAQSFVEASCEAAYPGLLDLITG